MFILNRKGLSLPLRGFLITNICYLFVLNVYGFDFFGNLGILTMSCFSLQNTLLCLGKDHGNLHVSDPRTSVGANR